MISKDMRKIINDQIKAEFDSAYIYLAMSAYFEDQNLKGMAHWMKKQADEEVEHAERFIAYMYEVGARVELAEIAKPKKDYASPMEVFKETLKHEQLVTSMIHKMMDLAKSEKDYASEAMLTWFVNEQVEEEAHSEEIVKKLQFIGDSNHGIYLLDHELGAR